MRIWTFEKHLFPIVLSALLLNVGVAWAENIYSNTFSTTPSADFTTYGTGLSFDYDATDDRIEADRATAGFMGWYQLTAANTTNHSDVIVESKVQLVGDVPDNHYVWLGGICARTPPGSASFSNGYFAVIGAADCTDDPLRLRLGRDINHTLDGNSAVMTVLATGTMDIANNSNYVVSLTVESTNLTATLYDESGASQLDRITASDSTYSNGNAGLVGGTRSGSRDIHYDDFTLDSSPDAALVGTVFVIE